MTKTKLIELIRAEMGLPSHHVEAIVSGVFDQIRAALKRGEAVKIAGLGRFEIKTRAPRRGRDPVSGQIRTLDPAPNLSFRPSKLLKQKVNQD
ncbi:MAG: HU family DNA-binding protein [Deltaproteobacteria bacterium]|nr:HU family DNA-binding protein [Deltaproteobacteria bacterium]